MKTTWVPVLLVLIGYPSESTPQDPTSLPDADNQSEAEKFCFYYDGRPESDCRIGELHELTFGTGTALKNPVPALFLREGRWAFGQLEKDRDDLLLAQIQSHFCYANPNEGTIVRHSRSRTRGYDIRILRCSSKEVTESFYQSVVVLFLLKQQERRSRGAELP